MEIQGLDQLRRKLNKLEDFQRVLHDPMEESLALLQDWLATAPRKSAGAFSRLATPGQKRAYWAKVSSGEIQTTKAGGYKRTGSAKAWTYEVRMQSNGVRGIVGNNKPGVRFTQGDWQQPFHKESGWRTTEQALEKNADKIARKFEVVVRRELNR
jgi:hypothetical protein